jgi:zinc transport system substrate-binding protein
MNKFFFAILILLQFIAANAWALKVCSSIKPLHGIVSAIAADNTSELILDNAYVDLHHYALKPSDVLKIKQCEVIFIISKDFESFADKLNKIANKNSQIVELATNKNIKLLKTREKNIYSQEEDPDEEHEHEHHHHHGIYDYHIWLNIDNAKIMAKDIALHLTNLDPANKKIYEHNLENFLEQLSKLDAELTTNLRAVASAPYMVFHDAYQYFEEKYQLNGIGAISLNFSHPLSLHTMAEIKKIVATNKVRCIFKEPNLSNKLVEKIATNVKIQTINAEWIEATTDAYLLLMRNLATDMIDCLK